MKSHSPPNAPEQTLTRSIGERIKRLRTRRKLSLRDLATRAGVSATMISEVERGKKTPTIRIVSAIAGALVVPTHYLFEREEAIAGISVLRHGEQRVVDIAPGAVNVILGHPVKGSNVQFVRLELRKGASHEPVSHAVGSIERAHVLSGSVELTVGDDRVRLETGDSSLFVSDRSHLYRNIGRATAKVYLVVEMRGG